MRSCMDGVRRSDNDAGNGDRNAADGDRDKGCRNDDDTNDDDDVVGGSVDCALVAMASRLRSFRIAADPPAV